LNPNTDAFIFAAGLLHDLGKPVLVENLPMKYKYPQVDPSVPSSVNKNKGDRKDGTL